VGAAENCFRMGIGAEFFIAIDVHERGQPGTRPVDPALYGADRNVAYLRCFFIGEAGGSNQNDGLALVFRQMRQCAAQVGHVEMAILFRMHRHAA
jgi:hypothetical protein